MLPCIKLTHKSNKTLLNLFSIMCLVTQPLFSMEGTYDENEVLPEYAEGMIIIVIEESSVSNLNIEKLPSGIMHFGITSLDLLNDENEITFIDETVVGRPGIFGRIFLISTDVSVEILDLLMDFKNDSNVEYAFPNYCIYLQDSPNDYYFNHDIQQEYGLSKGQQGLHTMGAVEAWDTWDVAPSDNEIVIAIFDTGIDINHIDLIGEPVDDGELNHTRAPSIQNFQT